MKPEWILTLLTDPQGFWKLLQHYLTAPLTGNHLDTDFLAVSVVIFLFLLCGSLLVCRIGIACESHSEKKERENRQLAHYQEHCEKTAAFEPLAEREASYDI